MASNAPRQRRRLRQPWQCGFCNLQNLKEAEEFEENPDPVLSQNWIRELAELCGDFDAADVPHPAVSADGELHLTGRESGMLAARRERLSRNRRADRRRTGSLRCLTRWGLKIGACPRTRDQFETITAQTPGK